MQNSNSDVLAVEILSALNRLATLLEQQFAGDNQTPADDRRRYRPSSMLTTDQAAEVLGIRPNTLAQWRSRFSGLQGYPPVRKVRRSVRYKYSDLMKWLDSH